MLVQDIHTKLKVVLDKEASGVAFGGAPAFTPDELDLYLNQAYRELVIEKFRGINQLQEGFESSIARLSEFKGLFNFKYGAVGSKINNTNAIEFTDVLEDTGSFNDIMFIVDLEFINNGVVSNCNIVSHQIAQKFRQTDINIPFIQQPVAVIDGLSIVVYVDPIRVYSQAGPFEMNIVGIKYPTIIDNTQPTTNIDEVPDYFMDQVIDKAAVLLLENVEQPRVQTKSQLNQVAEQ